MGIERDDGSSGGPRVAICIVPRHDADLDVVTHTPRQPAARQPRGPKQAGDAGSRAPRLGAGKAGRYAVGQHVWHELHGRGRVVATNGSTYLVRWDLGAPETSVDASVIYSKKEWAARHQPGPPASVPRARRGLKRRVPASHPQAPRARPDAMRRLPHPWRSVPAALPAAARQDRLRVDVRQGGFAIVSRQWPHGDLLRCREAEDGSISARPDLAWVPQDPDEHREAVRRANDDLDAHLIRIGEIDGLRRLFILIRRLERGLSTTSASVQDLDRMKKPRRISVRIVPGGAPGSGRRA